MRRLWIACLMLLSVPAFAQSADSDHCDHPAACAKSAEAADASSERVLVDTRGAPARGPEDAKVTVVVFSDFECPFCARGAKTEKVLTQKYGDRIRFVFKNEPMPMHAHARIAAAAGLAAADQGKFWALHDWLFSQSDAPDEERIVAEAGKLGLDAGRLRADLDSGRFEAQISADQAEAKRLGVLGTPTYFVNGIRVTGAQSVEMFERIIDQELAQ